MTMTPQQTAEVLRKHAKWRNSHDPSTEYVGGANLTAALETAIAVMEATQTTISKMETVDQSEHDATLTPPTDDQIGEVFDQHTDVSVLLNPISPTHAMTRTAAIRFAKALFGQFKSER